MVIHNPSSPLDLSHPFRLFEQQLRILLGVPSLSLQQEQQESTGALSEFEVDALSRQRLQESARESVQTLDAIVKLADDIPNMRVGKEVLSDVKKALVELDLVSLACLLSPLVYLADMSFH